MPIFKAPTRDSRFVINEVLKLESYGNLPGFENASADVSTPWSRNLANSLPK